MAISTNDAVAVQNNIMKFEGFRKNKNLAFNQTDERTDFKQYNKTHTLTSSMIQLMSHAFSS